MAGEPGYYKNKKWCDACKMMVNYVSGGTKHFCVNCDSEVALTMTKEESKLLFEDIETKRRILFKKLGIPNQRRGRHKKGGEK